MCAFFNRKYSRFYKFYTLLLESGHWWLHSPPCCWSPPWCCWRQSTGCLPPAKSSGLAGRGSSLVSPPSSRSPRDLNTKMSLPWQLELLAGLVDPQVLGSPWDQESIEGQADLGSQEDLEHPRVLVVLWSGVVHWTLNSVPVAIRAVQNHFLSHHLPIGPSAGCLSDRKVSQVERRAADMRTSKMGTRIRRRCASSWPAVILAVTTFSTCWPIHFQVVKKYYGNIGKEVQRTHLWPEPPRPPGWAAPDVEKTLGPLPIQSTITSRPTKASSWISKQLVGNPHIHVWFPTPC